MTSKEHFDIVSIIPLELELLEFLKIFPSVEDRSTPSQLIHVVNTGTPSVRMLVTLQSDMGKQHTFNAALKILESYDTSMLLCLGIAGGLSHDLKLGDVCYTGELMDINDNAKAVDKEGACDFEFSPTNYQADLNITTPLNFIRTQPALKKIYEDWQSERGEQAKILGEVPGRETSNEIIGQPNTMNGIIVCGDVNKSDNYTDRLKKMNRRVLAIETESGAIFSLAREKNIFALSIRGISDYADSKKTELEKASKGSVRKLAAANAVTFLKMQFGNPYFIRTLEQKKSPGQLPLPIVSPSPTDVLRINLAKISDGIDAKMRELSLEYHLQPKGYRIPVPRLKSVARKESVTNPVATTPIEVIEALKNNHAAVINLDRTYPDQSLAYVIAKSLLAEEIDSKQIVPVVVDGELIKPPQGTFAAVAQLPLKDLTILPGAQLVLIIDNPPISSTSRRKFMIDQVQALKGARVLIISRDEANLTVESELTAMLSADIYRICRVSFVEMAHFVEKNFGMDAPEAGVIAKRLNDTFSQFNLSAHPSYFAGIQREALMALLHANRRSELIQLAVAGFLTLLVADDRAKHRLARTTRELFLRKIVYAMKVDGKKFSQAELISYTSVFAKENDFKVDPMAFINDFLNHGILHFHNDELRFSLSFIEAYLLSAELGDNPQATTVYFNPEKPDFDFPTFDLYAEQKPDVAIILNITKAVNSALEDIITPVDRKHILLGDELRPGIIKDLVKLSSIQSSLDEARKDIGSGKNHNKRKQKLLDLNEAVQEAAAEKARQSKADIANEPELIKKLNKALRIWLAATILLGSGAERLDAQAKRKLSGDVIALASVIIDEWTRHAMTFDAQKLKVELTNGENLAVLQSRQPEGTDENETKKLISNLVDLIEYSILAYPFIRLMAILCEHARRSVLEESILHTTVQGNLENLIRGAWIADIDVSSGKKPLGEAIKNLPYAPFLRITLASHCMTRVFWSHWRSENRHALLDAASSAIQPLAQINKGALARMIDKEEKSNDSGHGGTESSLDAA